MFQGGILARYRRALNGNEKGLVVSVGILLVVGVSLCFLIPYFKDLANHEFIIAPLIILNIHTKFH
jgi:hypothetical protein